MLSDETRISNTLSSLEADFLSAVQHGPDALFTYQKSWSNFNTEITNCVNQLHEDTKLKIFNFTARMSTMASMFLNVTTAADNLGRQLEEDITSIVREDFAKLSIQDKPYPITDNSVAPYIPLTYKWLLDNLHNPYPTKDIRLSISSSTNSPVKDIDAWFIDARKRIGWNQLRKEHFTTRGDLIKAATEFFMPAQSVLSPPRRFIRLGSIKRDFSSQFAHIEARAQSLYSDRLFPSNLASNLENMIANPSEAISETQEQRQRSRLLENLTSYPTPEYSPASTSSPLPDSSSNASFGSSRKRSRSYSEPLSDDELPVPRNAKLKRHVSSEELEHATATSLPSPAMSLREIGSNGSPSSVGLPTSWKSTEHSAGKRKHPSTDVDGRPWKRANTEMLAHTNHVDELLSTSLSPAVIRTSAKRKRSLTDDHERPPKRPSNSDSAQSQTISNPLLFSAQSTLDDWFKGIPLSEYQITLDIPAPVTEENFDEFSEFDVDYYNYDFSSCPNQTTDITPALEPSINSLELQDANFPQHSRDMPSNHLWDSASSAININQPADNLPSFSWDFDALSTSSGSSGSWESALLTDLLSPDWTNDPSSISRILSQSTWQSGDIANHLASSTETSITSPFGSTAFPLSTPHMSDAKTTKLHQYHKLLAEAQLLRAELAI